MTDLPSDDVPVIDVISAHRIIYIPERIIHGVRRSREVCVDGGTRRCGSIDRQCYRMVTAARELTDRRQNSNLKACSEQRTHNVTL